METKIIKGLSEIQSKYDAFFIDLWGVIHNGVQLYPEAINVLENLEKLNIRYKTDWNCICGDLDIREEGSRF